MFLIFAVVIVGLTYFNVDLRGMIEESTRHPVVSQVVDATFVLWDNYLSVPVRYIWEVFFVGIIFSPVFDALGDFDPSAIPIESESMSKSVPSLPPLIINP